jgi:hypothetical protein
LSSSTLTNRIFFQHPKAASTPSETHSCLALSTRKYVTGTVSLDIRTDSQLRTGSSPATDEVAQVFFKYVNATHYYYFLLKSDGWELGKKDNLSTNVNPDYKRILDSGATPTITTGTFQHVEISIEYENAAVNFLYADENNNPFRIIVTVDDVEIANVLDNGYLSDTNGAINTPTLVLSCAGSVGLYSKDARGAFDNINIVDSGNFLYDTFENSGLYLLAEGNTSADSKWIATEDGGGYQGIITDVNDAANKVYFLQPQTATASDQTYTAFALSAQAMNTADDKWITQFNMRTDQQLRTGSAPAADEAAWFYWHYLDSSNYYYFVIKTTGWEFGRIDGGSPTVVDSGSEVTLSLGESNHVLIQQSEGIYTDIAVDGIILATGVNGGGSVTLRTGTKIGLAAKDSKVAFENVYFR